MQPGESLRLVGRWGSHPRYGRQFEVESYTTVLPATIQGIERHLGSGLIKGIGPWTAVLALSAASGGFTVAEFTAKVHTMTGHTGYTIRQAAYDLRKLRGKELITKPGRTRRYHLEPQTAGTIAALLTLREQVIAPILAGVRSPRMGRKPVTWTSVDRDYEKIRIDMQTLFQDLGIRAAG